MAAIDQRLHLIGGVPTYVLTDNEKTVMVEHVAGIAVRNPQMVAFAAALRVGTSHVCVGPPGVQGRVGNAVKIAKADPVPIEANLLDDYASFAELADACAKFTGEVNQRPHRVIRRRLQQDSISSIIHQS